MGLSIDSIPGSAKLLQDIESSPLGDGFKERFALIAEFSGEKVKLLDAAETGEQNSSGRRRRICNLALQGGGALGLAHIGFIAGLEKAGVRFVGLAGTSAGAIVACAMACARGRSLENPVAETLLEIISAMPMSSFIDGPPSVRALIKRYLAGKNLYSPRAALGGLMAARLLIEKRGLNPGEEFETWLRVTFSKLGVDSVIQLDDRLEELARRLRDATTSDGQKKPFAALKSSELLKIVATAQPAGIKFTFPEDMRYIHNSYSSLTPASFVRASMSVPAFFQPKYFEVDRQNWAARVATALGSSEADEIVEELKRRSNVAFVDGGLLSNLPLDAFSRIPGVPTLAISLTTKVSADKTEYRYRASLRGVLTDLQLLLNAMRRQRDRDALERARQSPEASLIHITKIDTGNANWLNFSMSQAEMGDLFLAGLGAAKNYVMQ